MFKSLKNKAQVAAKKIGEKTGHVGSASAVVKRTTLTRHFLLRVDVHMNLTLTRVTESLVVYT
jgi:hypothetical protein